MSSTAMESPSPDLLVAGTPSFCRSVMSENESVMTEMKQPQEEDGINSSWSVGQQQQQHGEETVTCTPYTNIRNESVIEFNGSEISGDSNNNSPAASVEVISTEVGHSLATEEVFESDAFATRSPLPSSRKIRAVEVNLFESSPVGGTGQWVQESVPLYPTSPEEKVLIEQQKIPSCSTLESFDAHSPTRKLTHLKYFAIIVIGAIIFMIPHFMGINSPQSSSLRQLAIDHPLKSIPMYLTTEITEDDVSAPLEADFVGSLIVSQPSEPVQQQQQQSPPITEQPSSNPLKLHVLISVNKTSKSKQEPADKGLARRLSRALGSVNSSAVRSVTSKIAGALTHWAHSVEQVLLPALDGNELEYML